MSSTTPSQKRTRSPTPPPKNADTSPLPELDDLQDFITPDNPASLDTAAALAYWGSVTPDDSGVLGGYPHVSRADLQGSRNFVGKLRRSSKVYGKGVQGVSGGGKFERVVDCGAGIGRVTLGFLSKVATVVDVVEPVERLTRVVTEGEGFAALREAGTIGKVYNVGIQEWIPEQMYDVIWTQWCCGQLTDEQLVAYFMRVMPSVKPGGWLVVKENMSTDPEGRDIFDRTDSSVTRTDEKFRQLFRRAGLRIVLQEVQAGMPREIYPIRTYALQLDGER